MISDEFSEHYRDHLDGIYDCVDRIVLNGYFPLAQSGGGFRLWWRRLHGGKHDLDNAHLMRYAGRFARRIRAYASKRGIPLIECQRGERKHEVAGRHLPKDPAFRGLFCILVGRAPAPVRHIRRCSNGQPHIARKAPQPYVNHYSFHIMDPQWGHLTIKLCPHPPFNAQIMLNGHEYVARQAIRRNIPFAKEGNCFTQVSDAADLSRVADTMSAGSAVGRLVQVCERWIYSACLVFALDLAEQERCGFRYAYSVYQCEYSRNLLFTRGRTMEEVFQGVIDRIRAPLDIKTVKTIFGYKNRPYHRDASGKLPRFEVSVERPVYDLTVFKVHFGKVTVKIYSKGKRVLRIEVIVHNTRDLRCGRRIDAFPQIVASLKSILERFLSVLRNVDISFLDDQTLETWPLPSKVGSTRVAGVDINQRRMRAVMEAVIARSVNPQGFTASQIAGRVREILGVAEAGYHSRQASYDLRKLRGKCLVHKISDSRRYQTTPDGLSAMVAFLVLRDKVLIPLLAGRRKRKTRRKPRNPSRIDLHYEKIQMAMQELFETLRIAA